MKNYVWKRITAALLCIVMLLPFFGEILLPALSFTAAAAANPNASENTSATSKETIYLDGVYYDIQKTLSYQGNNTYRLDMELTSTISKDETTIRRTAAKNGYFTVETSGYYLLELWGGEGHRGGNIEYLNATTVIPGGSGGQSGYVYAKVYLEAGQTLAYSIGTNGDSTLREDEGGGVNGGGGEHGDVGSYEVGGGGGYSALYFFEEGEFDPSWLSQFGHWNIPESVRTSKYVMIAAGGGGGGAGNSVLTPNHVTEDGRRYYAHGGAGGSITNGVSMTLSGDSYPVNGYIFSGRNGSSSGTQTRFVGKGGSNVPGQSPSTAVGWITADPSPNDWTGTYNIDVAPGAGGTGNLRGGGGGAGYCGGSGGIMYGLAVAENVGGGGGGSSFLAEKVGGLATVFGASLDSETKELLTGVSNCPSSVGGAFTYTYLGASAEEKPENTDYLTSIRVNGTYSKYFNVISSVAIDQYGNENGTIIHNNTNNSFSITSANIDAAHSQKEGTLLRIQLMLQPKEGFLGGNRVPLLQSLGAYITKDNTTKTITASANEKTDYANVPIKISVITKSMTESLKPGMEPPTFLFTDLYQNDHATAINAFKNGYSRTWQYDFLTNLSSYSVYEGKDGAVGTPLSGTETPGITQTTYYSIAITATPKTSDGYAVVGPKNETPATFHGVASIGIVNADIFDAEDGWGYTLSAEKNLQHDGSNYIFTTTMGQNVELTYGNSTPYTGNGNYTADKDGYYLVQLWGGDGGNGGRATAVAKSWGLNPVTRTASGGSGASGGTIYAFVYLYAGDVLNMTLGTGGTNASPSTVGYGYGGEESRTYSTDCEGGTAGTASYIKLTRNGVTEYLLIAGGGGGGGGGAAGAAGSGSTYSASSAGTSATTSGSKITLATAPSAISSYNGNPGKAGNATGSGWLGTCTAQGGGAGSSGSNFGNSAYVNVGKTDAESVYVARLADALVNEGGVNKTHTYRYGKAQITFMCDLEDTAKLNAMPSVETEGTFSRYFELDTDASGDPLISMEIKGMSYNRREIVEVEGGKTISLYKDSLLQGKYTYVLTENADGTTTYQIKNTIYYPSFTVSTTTENGYIAHCGFDTVIKLKPRDGFLGGNDVPLLAESVGGYSTVKVIQGDKVGLLSPDGGVDYANVPIQYDLARDFATQDATLLLGDGDTSNDSVRVEDLYTLTTNLTPTDPNEAWKSEFVYLEKPLGTVYSPDKTETVDITAAILPITPTPQKALVTGASASLSVTLTATIYVRFHVTYDVTHMYYVGDSSAAWGEDFTIILTAEDGWLQPPLDGEVPYITVTVGGTQLDTFQYNQETGELTIAADKITAPIVITASAKVVEYTLHYVYFMQGDEVGVERTESYAAGEAIDYTWFNAFTAPEITGYEFSWVWDSDGAVAPSHMPARDVWAIGSYTKKSFTLTVNYLNSAGESIAPAYVKSIPYEESYSVSSPMIDGTLPSLAECDGVALSDPFVISGIMGEGNVTVNVTYLSQNNRVVILYLSKSGTELAPRHDQVYAEGDNYSITSPDVPGYTPDPAYTTVSGTIAADGSVYIRVYYTANRYNVTLEYKYTDIPYQGPKPAGTEGLPYLFDSAYLDGSGSITVEYDNIFSYDAATGNYGLPMPIVLGYTFVGWYLDPACTETVNESTVVKITSDTTLYAMWEPTKFNVTVIYDFVFDPGDFEPDYSMLPPHAKYHAENGYYYTQDAFYMTSDYLIPISPITGYTAYSNYNTAEKAVITELGGIMPGAPIVLYVTYEINIYTITFADLSGAYIRYPDTPTTPAAFDTVWYTAQLKHGVNPVYAELLPEHLYDPAAPDQALVDYSYIFQGWVEKDSGTEYAPTDILPTITGDITYYARYEAFENIACVANSSGTPQSYHHTLQGAIDKALTYKVTSESSAPRVLLRRNGDADTVDLTMTEVDTVQVNDNTASYSYYVVLDLNGYKLTYDRTLLNVTDRLSIWDTVGTGKIELHLAGDTIALTVADGGRLYLGRNNTTDPYTVNLSVGSTAGNACAVWSAEDVYLYAANITSEAISGNACAVWSAEDVYLYAANITSDAISGNAYGIHSAYYTYLYQNTDIRAITVTGDAYGILSENQVETKTSGAYIYAETVDGNAYGILAVVARLNSSNTDVALYTSIEAYSYNGNATGVETTSFAGYTVYANVTATAPHGTAIGINNTSNNTLWYGGGTSYKHTVTAEGNVAIGIKSTYYVYLYNTVIAAGTERAVGADLYRSDYNLYLTAYGGSQISASTDSGEAFTILGSELNFANSSIATIFTATANSGNAYLLYNAKVSGSPSTSAVLRAESLTGNAYGYYSDDASTRSFTSSALLSVYAPGGNAYGAYVGNNDYIDFDVFVEGMRAYGIYVVPGATADIRNTCAIDVNGLSEEHDTYGIYNEGTITQLYPTVNVTAKGPAYGIYHAGSMTYYAMNYALKVNAVSELANAYGLYLASGTTVGSNTRNEAVYYGAYAADVLSEGCIGYGLYAEDGATIYIRGTYLYYKGSEDAYAKAGDGIMIIEGYCEERLADDDASYPGYYHLVIIRYTMVFVHTDPDGNVLNESYATVEYSIEGIYGSAPSHPANDIDQGYWVDWEGYDFTPPESGLVKYVKSLWTPNQYAVYFHYSNYSYNYVLKYVDYKSPIVFPEASEMYYQGHSFTGEWYLDDAFTMPNTYTTMPAQEIHLYSKWTPNTYTLTLVTNTDLDTITFSGTYGTYYSFPAMVKPGYTFNAWYRDPEFNDHYTSSNYIYLPAENLTLYADWEISMSLVVLGEAKAYTVNLNVGFDTDGDGINDVTELVEQFVLPGDRLASISLTPSSIDMGLDQSGDTDMWFISSITEDLFGSGTKSSYVLRGWADKDGNPVILTEGIGSWNVKPVNGVIDLYAILEERTETLLTQDMLIDFLDYSIFGGDMLSIGDHYFHFFGGTQMAPGQYTTEAGCYALTYRALMDGEYTAYLFAFSSRNPNAKVSVLKPDGTSTVVYEGSPGMYSGSGNPTMDQIKQLKVYMNKGDVLVMEIVEDTPLEGDTSSSIFYGMVDLPLDPTSLGEDAMVQLYELIFEFEMHNAIDVKIFTIESDPIHLPIDPAPGYEDITGWSYRNTATGQLSAPIADNIVDVSMFDVTNAWVDMGNGMTMLQLYPLGAGSDIEGMTWIGYIVADRHFNPTAFQEELTSVVIRQGGAISFAFATESMIMPGTLLSLAFSTGLPAGATVSLIDFSGTYPEFYTFTVSPEEDGIKDIPLTRFQRAGGTGFFGGTSGMLMFNVSYRSTQHSIENETVTLSSNDSGCGIELSYTLLPTSKAELGSMSLTFSNPLEGTVPVPTLTNKGHGTNDRVVLVIRMTDAEGNVVPFPASMRLEAVGGVIESYTDFAIADLGLVRYYNGASSVMGYLYLDALRYEGFDGYFIYQIMVLPEGSTDISNIQGTNIHLDTEYRLRVSVSEDIPVSLGNSNKAYTTPGGVFQMDITAGDATTDQEIGLYLYQRDGATMITTDACRSLLEGFTVDENGRATYLDGQVLTAGALELQVAQNAAPGTYYLMVTHGNSYAIFTLIVESGEINDNPNA